MVSPLRKYDYMAGRDAQLTVLPYRPRGYVPTTIEYWWEKASCQSSPAELFEPSLGGKANKGKSRQTVVQENEERFDEARSICLGCPVINDCLAKATPQDLFYTMRAGLEPAQFTQYKQLGEIREKGNQESGEKATCLRGHNNWKMWGKARPRRKCVDCDKMSPEEKATFDRMNAVD